jgi:PH domain
MQRPAGVFSSEIRNTVHQQLLAAITEAGMESIATTEHKERPQSKSGYLLKCSPTGQHRKRFFEINGEYLTYFKTEKKRKLLEAISIPSAAHIRLTDGYNSHPILSPHSGGHTTILIDMCDRQYELIADTVEDAQLWMNEILKIRDAELMRCQSERSTRQNWTFTASGKTLRNSYFEASGVSRDPSFDRLSIATESVDERDETDFTVEDLQTQRSFFIRNRVCCSCIPVMF